MKTSFDILLADDDTDDCFFFEKALAEMGLATHLTIVHDGEHLMNHLLGNSNQFPKVLFLDLSMPRKNGFECLIEIKESEILKHIPVVMFSTSFPSDRIYEDEMVKTLYNMGANDYIKKPGDFAKLKEVIYNSLSKVTDGKLPLEEAHL